MSAEQRGRAKGYRAFITAVSWEETAVIGLVRYRRAIVFRTPV